MYSRARLIVRIAADMTETPYLRNWFIADERGTWEKNADDYLKKTAERAVALNMTEKDVNEAIATQLCVLGLSSLIETKKRGESITVTKRRKK